MRTLGIDGGIASIGWGLLDLDPEAGVLTVVAAGVRTFDAPETSKERTPTNAVRRLHRGQRRVIRRRRQRMNEIRRLFHEAGLLPAAQSDALSQKGLNPWCLRAEALDRELTGAELAVGLGHIARHRGIQVQCQTRRRSKRSRRNLQNEKGHRRDAGTPARLPYRRRNVRHGYRIPRPQTQPRRLQPLHPARGPTTRGPPNLQGTKTARKPVRVRYAGGEFQPHRILPTPAPGQRAHGPVLPLRAGRETHRAPLLRLRTVPPPLPPRHHLAVSRRHGSPPGTRRKSASSPTISAKPKESHTNLSAKRSTWTTAPASSGLPKRTRKTTSSPAMATLRKAPTLCARSSAQPAGACSCTTLSFVTGSPKS